MKRTLSLIIFGVVPLLAIVAAIATLVFLSAWELPLRELFWTVYPYMYVGAVALYIYARKQAMKEGQPFWG